MSVPYVEYHLASHLAVLITFSPFEKCLTGGTSFLVDFSMHLCISKLLDLMSQSIVDDLSLYTSSMLLGIIVSCCTFPLKRAN